MRSCSSSCPVVSTVGVSSRRAMRSQQLGLLAGVLGGADLVADLLELLARLVDLALGLLGAVAAGLRLAAGLLERGGKVGGGLLEILDALERGEQARDDGGGVVEVGDRVALDARDPDRASPRSRGRRRRGAPRARRARRRPTGSARAGGRRRACRPCASRPTAAARSRAPARSARTTTGCCWRMRMSMRLRGSSKERSSRKSEKSKPSSSLTGMKTISSGNVRLSGAKIALTFCFARVRGASPLSRKRRHASASAGAWSTSVSNRPLPSTSAASRPNSSSAGSLHLETAPWPSVRTKNPLMSCVRSASSGSSETRRLVDVRVLRGGVCWMGFMGGRRAKPLLQEHGCRTGVLGHHPPGSARQLRGEAFVVDLNRQVEPITQPLDERSGLPSLIRVASGQRQRQPDEHRPGLELLDQRDEPPEALAGRRAQHRIERRGERAGRIGDRDAAARAAVVERDDAAQASACRTTSSRRPEGVGQLLGIAAAGLGHVVAAATAAADHLRRGLDDVAGLDAALDRRRAWRRRAG